MNKGPFEPKVMYFRLCNSPGTFQRMINNIFRELLHKKVLAKDSRKAEFLLQMIKVQF